MKLYDFQMAPNPRRARIFLAEKGLELETVQIDMMQGEQLSDDYRKINPRCTIPSLELDDGTVLTENTAIADYLEAIAPEPPLMGRNAVERALVVEWNAIVERDGIGSLADVFRNTNPAFADRATVGPDNYAQIPELAERGLSRAAAFLKSLDGRLEGREFLATDDFSFADITAQVAVDFAKMARVEVSDSHENLHAWHARVSARPSAQA
ncbi:MAG: glutathione S-transferase family protein [Myxococcota bacterium]|nr:glutathione S-transferase family protein [Myxococcota bacterium]